MRNKLKSYVWLAWLLAGGSACLATDTADMSTRFTGSFSGTGRACGGALQVNDKTITWETAFSQCQGVAYDVLEQSQQGNERRYVYQLKKPGKACLYEVLYLYHRDTQKSDIDWHVIGYKTFADYTKDKQHGYKANSPDSLACYLVKE